MRASNNEQRTNRIAFGKKTEPCLPNGNYVQWNNFSSNNAKLCLLLDLQHWMVSDMVWRVNEDPSAFGTVTLNTILALWDFFLLRVVLSMASTSEFRSFRIPTQSMLKWAKLCN